MALLHDLLVWKEARGIVTRAYLQDETREVSECSLRMIPGPSRESKLYVKGRKHSLARTVSLCSWLIAPQGLLLHSRVSLEHCILVCVSANSLGPPDFQQLIRSFSIHATSSVLADCIAKQAHLNAIVPLQFPRLSPWTFSKIYSGSLVLQ